MKRGRKGGTETRPGGRTAALGNGAKLPHEEDGNAEKKRDEGSTDVAEEMAEVIQRLEPAGYGSYWLTRVLFLRCLGFIYGIAFLVAFQQNDALLGENGLTPAIAFIKRVRQAHPAGTPLFEIIRQHPTVFLLVSPTSANLRLVSAIGLCLSLLVTIGGRANAIMMLLLWAAYFSIVTVGQTWYSFGWESQLLETGFLAIFLVPLLSLAKFPRWTPTPLVCLWGYRWLLLRIMLGAGLIKIRGDSCWRDLTCMMYHYQTQPVPNPLSPILHATAPSFHYFETAGNHFIELVAPWLLVMPRSFRIVGGVLQVLFQMILIASGNLSFLNWLTALPAIMCFDDASLAFLFSSRDLHEACETQRRYKEEIEAPLPPTRKSPKGAQQTAAQASSSAPFSWARLSITTRRLVGLAVTVLIVSESIPVVMNLFSPHQSMNASFNSLRIVNTYGAFGSITRSRYEVILQGTRDQFYPGSGTDTKWVDLEFTCKPGDLNRRPCVISPYHFRIDWLMWFAAFQSYQQCPWLVSLAHKLLQQDRLANTLLAKGGNPFADGEPPKFIRAELYLYEYEYSSYPSALRMLLPGAQRNVDKPASGDVERGVWEVGRHWRRKHVSSYMPPIDLKNPSVVDFLRQTGLY